MPAAEYIQHLTTDLTVHAWDLAQATGGDTDLDGELVTAGLIFADRYPDAEIPERLDTVLDASDAAPPQMRLLARYGRKS